MLSRKPTGCFQNLIKVERVQLQARNQQHGDLLVLMAPIISRQTDKRNFFAKLRMRPQTIGIPL